jgi:hypothetical protein
MADKSPVFDETYKNYLSQIAKLELADYQVMLGFEIQDGQAIMPFFNTIYRINAKGIVDSQGHTPPLSICIILFKYLLMCPRSIPQAGQLAAYKDFKDAGPLINFFSNTVEGEVVRNFSGRLSALEKACLALGGKPYGEDLAYQIKYKFHGLPRIPLYLFYNDEEEGFDAQCSILFERRTEAFLDMESVAILGSCLSQMLAVSQKGLS